MLAGALVLVYIYGGYALLLKIIASFHGGQTSPSPCRDEELPSVTVLITVYNEKDGIEERIKNVLACAYPAERLEILVASDGSTDGTDGCVAAMEDARVKLFRPAVRRGKTDTQNQAVARAVGELLVFTDAATRFAPLFLREIVQPFSDQSVGGVDGHLLFVSDPGIGLSQSQGRYWRQELQIRTLESDLGILAVASGACLAVRRKLFRPMLQTVGEDCLVPLDVVDQGYRMVHATRAVAYDQMDSDSAKEFKTRVRMTLRNWQGTWNYPRLLNPLRHPGIAWGLWSHKVLRWLSPFFLLVWLSGSLRVFLLGDGWATAAIPGMSFIFIAGVAVVAELFAWRVRWLSLVFSFCLANYGFLVGVIRALLGNKVTVYR